MQYAGTKYDPMLWATYIFHPQIFNRAAFFEIGLFNTSYSSGDEVDAHIKISNRFGPTSIEYINDCLYRYRNNFSSVVHNANYYTELIGNIEQILSAHYYLRTSEISIAKRIGRCINTNAAHYQHYNEKGLKIDLPYFDFNTMKFV